MLPFFVCLIVVVGLSVGQIQPRDYSLRSQELILQSPTPSNIFEDFGFGSSIRAIGDIDSDGSEDFLIGYLGAFVGNNPNFFFPDQVSIAFFNPNNTLRELVPIRPFGTPPPSIRFGNSGARIRFPEESANISLGVGAPFEGDGALYLFKLSSNFSIDLGAPQRKLFLSELVAVTPNRWGIDVQDLQDFNNDMVVDISVASVNRVDFLAISSDFGTISLVNSLVTSNFTVVDFRFDSVLSVGRFDGDNIGDIVLFSRNPSPDPSSSVLFVFLTAMGGISSYTPIGIPADSTATSAISSFALTPDINNDGIPDAIWAFQRNANETGELFLVELGPDGSALSARPVDISNLAHSSAAEFGHALELLQISTQNSIKILVSSPEEDFTSGNAGAIFYLQFTECGDQSTVSPEECDDGNNNNGDGCSEFCFFETGWICDASAVPSICTPVCGDSIIVGPEGCDDGNTESGDGCSSTCVPESNNDSQVNLAPILAPIFVGLFCVCICVVLAIVFGAHYYKKRSLSEIQKHQLQIISRQQIPILTEIRIGKVIGNGQFGTVYQGIWNNLTEVALKSIKNQNLEDFSNELNLSLEMKHPNVLLFYGIFLKDQESFMVTEFMNSGSLLQFLQAEPSIKTRQLIDFTIQIAKGMDYIQDSDIIHRDLAARNVLVSSTSKSDYVLKIADFGLSRRSESNFQTNLKLLPIRWTAIEVLQTGQYHKKSDVWAFGVVLWEIFSRGSIPFAGFSNKQVIEQVKQGARLAPPLDMPVFIEEVMLNCWDEAIEARPSFSEAVQILESGLKQLRATKDLSQVSLKLQAKRKSMHVPSAMPAFVSTKDQLGLTDENRKGSVQAMSEKDKLAYTSLLQENLKLRKELNQLKKAQSRSTGHISTVSVEQWYNNNDN